MEHQEYEFTLGLVNDDTNELFLHFSARVNPKDDSADERLRARYARAVMKQRRR